MNICMLAPEFIPVWGGVGTYIVELIKNLPKEVNIHVVTPMRESYGKEKISTLDYNFDEYFNDNIHVHFISTANDTFFYNAKFQYACQKYVPKLIKENDIDIVHSHTAHMSDILLQYKKINAPIVTTIHTTIKGQRKGTEKSDMGFFNLEFSEKITHLSYYGLRFLEELYFRRDRKYLTVSNWMKESITKDYPSINKEDIRVVYNSIDPKIYCPLDNKQDNTKKEILFTGRLVAAKGIKYIIEAIPPVISEYPDVEFKFIGAGNKSPYVNELEKQNISKNNYNFIGYVKETREMVEHYRNADIYLAPTLYENLPIRILEAMGCGAPVIASSVSAIPEIITDGENGLLISPGDSNELTECIIKLLDDPILSKKISQEGRKTVLEKFNWKKNSNKIMNFYEEVISDYKNKKMRKIP
ncbi:MAG: glycosyltransferase family 4 protein [Candidatus Lokiarchaeota archaeon]|nr:glycosyltransferase family 4 protein [Candidatus Lokiarchaeota archaeon]